MVSNCSLVIQADMRPVAGNSFYLVPSFASFLSLFDHLCVPVFCWYFFSFQLLVWRKMSETLIQCSDFCGKQVEPFKNRMCAFFDLHAVQQSSQMSHVMWISCNSWCHSLFLSFTKPQCSTLKQVSDSFLTLGSVSIVTVWRPMFIQCSKQCCSKS